METGGEDSNGTGSVTKKKENKMTAPVPVSPWTSRIKRRATTI